jgi:hypothetical protein
MRAGRYVLSRQFNLQSTRSQSLLLVVSELVVQVGELRDPSLFEAQRLQKNKYNLLCVARQHRRRFCESDTSARKKRFVSRARFSLSRSGF